MRSIENYHPKFLIQHGNSINTYDFPGKLTNAQWHVLKCQRERNSIMLTADNRRENVIQNCIRNPSLIEVDSGVAWNVHAPIEVAGMHVKLQCAQLKFNERLKALVDTPPITPQNASESLAADPAGPRSVVPKTVEDTDYCIWSR
ncbi:unnamed protein product [Didymodactylos carnosus]|uniref:Uncharacterized protein n=1 Tax=Didymodactylos carnosus TaxID=1234261 RepID=A0A8S2DSC1_9BILA|nr:unnamed protein product [Didymodactylos carnosus]CAF3811057.1 unnamed protein product [Didymodactylos carnosus]